MTNYFKSICMTHRLQRCFLDIMLGIVIQLGTNLCRKASLHPPFCVLMPVLPFWLVADFCFIKK